MTSKLIPTQRSDYDYSSMIAAAKKESQYISFSTFIDEKIRILRAKDYYGEGKRYTRSYLAEMIGLDLDTLTKIINGRQATRKRDIIIAVSAGRKGPFRAGEKGPISAG